jgi:Flp pilus assembly protein TadD
VGWLWYLGTLVPMIGLVQIAGHGRADRYTYVPHIGLTIAVVWLLSEVAERHPAWRHPLRIALGVAVLACVLATWRQTAHWHDTVSLWEHALAVTTGNHEAHRNLAKLSEREGKFDEARKHYEAALACHPDKRVVHNDLGALFMRDRRYDESARHFLKSLEIDPAHAETRNNLGSLYLMQGRPDDAVKYLTEARAMNPAFAGTHFNLALARVMQGRFDEAAAHFADGQRLDATNAVAHHSYGVALRNRSRWDLAVPQFEAAVALQPESAEYHSDLGLALQFSRQLPRAVQEFREAVRLNGTASRYHRYLAHALNQSGDATGATFHYRESLGHDRRWPEVLDQQAWRMAGYPDAAVRNGPVAVHLAEQVCQATEFRNAMFVDTLAAAYAEAGRFDEAAATARKAVDLAVAARQEDLLGEMRDRLKLYEAKQPFRGRVETPR